MILLILAILIALILLGLKMDDYDFGTGITAISFVGTVIVIIIAIILGISVSKLSVIDEKITMYEEENAAIEEQIDIIVKQYQDYETEIFTNTSSDSVVTLVSLYPELKSDSLVNSQIDVYMSNRAKIKELKETKINGSVYRWWLYFG